MRFPISLGLAAAMALASAGCGWQSGDAPTASIGAVAVVDLDEIARRVGSDKQIAASINQRQAALRQQLVNLSNSYRQQIEEQQKALPADQAEQSEVTLASWQQQASASFNQVKQQAEVDLQSHRARLVDQFRDQVKPAARRVAQRRGLTVIVTKNDAVVFDYASTADITDEVVDELLANPAPASTAGTASEQPSAPPAEPSQQAAASGPTQR